RARLPARFRTLSPEVLAEGLRRQVAAGVLQQYPKYRSQQDRFWDRPMPVHVDFLLRSTLQEGPLPLSELRRKLPAYALGPWEEVLRDQVTQGKLHEPPRLSSRGPARYGVTPPDPKDYLRPRLADLFTSLAGLGFNQGQLRAAALELLHDEEWAPTAPPGAEPGKAPSGPPDVTSGLTAPAQPAPPPTAASPPPDRGHGPGQSS